MPARITVLTNDGRELRNERSDYQGFWRTRPLDWDGAMEKFERNTDSVDGLNLEGVLRT